MIQVRLQEVEKQEIIKLYNKGFKIKDISKRYNERNRTSILYLLKKRGCKIREQKEERRIYPINESFFDNINSEEKAYILGLLYADGYNSKRNNTVRLILQERDKNILYKINDLIQPTKPLSFIRSKNKNHQNYYSLSIHNIHISNQLEKLGCGQAKTFDIKFPNFLPSNLIVHFVRGYVDGDGYIGVGSKKCLSIVSNKDFCTSLINIFPNYHFSKIINKRGDNRIVTLHMSGRKQIESFLNLLYSNANIYIDRKYDAYKELLEFNEIRNKKIK